MRKIINSTYITLDGVIEGPHLWPSLDRPSDAAVTRLKQEPGENIVQYGFGAVSRLLLEHGLLDELRLWVHPLILGRGSPSDLLFGPSPTVAFHLTDATTLSDGAVILTYRTDKTLAEAA